MAKLIDAVIVRDPRTGRTETVCRECVGVDDHIEGGPVSTMEPSRVRGCERCGTAFEYHDDDIPPRL